jgi:hypothetical protein
MNDTRQQHNAVFWCISSMPNIAGSRTEMFNQVFTRVKFTFGGHFPCIVTSIGTLTGFQSDNVGRH